MSSGPHLPGFVALVSANLADAGPGRYSTWEHADNSEFLSAMEFLETQLPRGGPASQLSARLRTLPLGVQSKKNWESLAQWAEPIFSGANTDTFGGGTPK